MRFNLKFKRLDNERGCIFGGGGGGGSAPPAPTPIPAPPPSPVPTPSEISPQSENERRKRLDKLRSGYAATIKTSAKGIFSGGNAELQSSGAGKGKLGS